MTVVPAVVQSWCLVGLRLFAVALVLQASHVFAAQDPAVAASLPAAERLFYNGNYVAASAMATDLRKADAQDLAAYELATSALHFQIKRLLGDAKDKELALKQCPACPDILSAFTDEMTRGLAVARARLAADPQDLDATFMLGKLDLNHVWLQIGTLGRRTAWSEYREARRSIETVLKHDPTHVRARIAHAWIEYIVDTRVPFGFQWVLGGGDRKKAILEVKQAANAEAPFFVKTEARFALWEMQIRDKLLAEAVATARELLVDFPENRELVRFVGANARD